MVAMARRRRTVSCFRIPAISTIRPAKLKPDEIEFRAGLGKRCNKLEVNCGPPLCAAGLAFRHLRGVMDNPEDFATVFRSGDHSADEDAARVRDLLMQAGLDPVVLSDKEPGVPIGSVEVRVPASQEALAERALTAVAREAGDRSHELDLVAVYEGGGTTGEIEALSIRGILDAAGIPAVLTGTSAIPNLPFGVKVPRSFADQARGAIEEALRAGPNAAEEAEQSQEGRTTQD